MQVLRSSAVPGIPSTTIRLTAAGLAEDASIPGLASKIASWGYVDGRERTFQGESRHLSLVVSRSLAFGDASGASNFVGFLHDNAGAYFGDATVVRALQAEGRIGWLFSLPPCACAKATPAFVGVLAVGSDVVWLEINGSDATPELLTRLLDPAKSAPVP